MFIIAYNSEDDGLFYISRRKNLRRQLTSECFFGDFSEANALLFKIKGEDIRIFERSAVLNTQDILTQISANEVSEAVLPLLK